jgi:hypothetical protein
VRGGLGTCFGVYTVSSNQQSTVISDGVVVFLSLFDHNRRPIAAYAGEVTSG